MHHQLPFVARANRFLSRAWAEGWWPEPTLDGAALIAEACRREGVDTIPGKHWQEPFHLLLRDLVDEADLNPLGRQVANGQLVTLLRMRIRAEQLLRSHSEISERPITAPVLIVGHMRSGTTRLHRLLASDPRFAHTRLFESLEPVPRRGRLLRAAAVQGFLHRANPALAAIHPSGPLQAEEEFGLHSLSLHGAQLEVQWHLPRFAAYARRRDLTVPYREFAALLRIIGWSRRESAEKPWLLKSPQFTGELGAVLRQFPDARLLCLTRDPVAVVGSSASLVWNQRRLHSDSADPRQVGAEWLEETLRREAHLREVVAEHPQVQCLQVGFDEVSADWRAAVQRIYAYLGLPLTEGVIRRMNGTMARPARHQGHQYRLEDFGLTANGVTEALAAVRS